MITLQMNRHEVHAQFQKDEGFRRFFDHKIEEWKKIKKKMLPKQIGGKAWPWHSKKLHQDFIFIMCKQTIYDDAVAVYAKVRGNGRDYYYAPNINAPEMVCVFSTHFWQRYAERMGFLFAMPQVIVKFHSRNPYQNAIYVNMVENRVVYATHDGILLCEIDQKRGLYIIRTFVSKAMLKETQREAYNVLDQLTAELDEYFGAACRADILDFASDAIQDYIKEFSLQASDIYAQYWENE